MLQYEAEQSQRHVKWVCGHGAKNIYLKNTVENAM